MMTDKTGTPIVVTKVTADRRNVLRGAAVLAAAIPVSASAVSAGAERLVQPTDHQVGGRYKDSEHVQRFYELNRR